MQEIVTCSNALLLKLMRVEMETTQRQLEERHRPHQPVDRSFQALAGTPVQRQRGGDWRTLSVAYVPKWNNKRLLSVRLSKDLPFDGEVLPFAIGIC